jgi:Uma2 family endonuclease
MSHATTDPLPPASSPVNGSPPSLPSFDELSRWTSEPDHRVVIRGVDWAFYERLVDSIPEGANIHVDFDGKDVEIMSPSALHDGDKKLFGQLVEAVAQELEVPYKSAGQTTWRRPEVARGLESDECYFFRSDKLAQVAGARARRSTKIADFPNPDLAVEVDITPSKIDRPGIYSALKVTEVWRFDGEREEVIIERLGADGYFHRVEGSMFLPILATEVRRWVVEEDSSDESAWARRLRAWARALLGPRLNKHDQ